MITTLTLNPAIDKTLIVDNFSVDSVNRVGSVSSQPGGKGVNASRVIKRLGEDTVALGFLAGAAGREIASMLDRQGIKHDFVWVEGETRLNTKLVDTVNSTCTDINESGPNISGEQLSALKKKVCGYAIKSDVLVFSGSAPGGVPETVYGDLIRELESRIILDTVGELLRHGISAKPWMIKPNISEFSEAIGFRPKNTGEVIAECKKLNAYGIEYVCVSMGAEGLIMSGRGKVLIAVPPKIKALNTVGAGDSAVGSLAVSLVRNTPMDAALREACAVSAASVSLPGTEVPPERLIRQIYEQVEIYSGTGSL